LYARFRDEAQENVARSLLREYKPEFVSGPAGAQVARYAAITVARR